MKLLRSIFSLNPAPHLMEGRKILLLLSFLVFTCSYSTIAQIKEDKKDLFENGEFFYNSEDYQEAVFYYLKLHAADPENGNVNYHIGSCYINIPGQERKSIAYFEQALPQIEEKYTSANFKSSLDQDKAPLHTYFFLAKAYRMDDQMDKALEMLDKFSNSVYFEGKYNESMVTAEFDACKKAQIIMERPVTVAFSNLGPAINNANENYNPVLNEDSTIIIYMNNLKFYNAIFMSVKSGGSWQEADNITPQVGSDGDSYPTYLSPDGKTLLLVKRIKKNTDIYISHFVHDKWSLMEPLDENINTRWNETHASMSADGKTLYFASDRKGTLGGLDIWYSPLQPDGQWGKAVNLGPDINTKLDEDNPFETTDGKVLFFASQGHMNMGGFDIFYSKKVDNKWSKAVNLGYPINTTTDDKFYFPMGKGIIGYMGRRMSKGFGLQDIYRLSITGGDPIKDIFPEYKNEPMTSDNKLNDSKPGKSNDSARIITDSRTEQPHNVQDRLAVGTLDTAKETKQPAVSGQLASPDKPVSSVKIDSLIKSPDILHITGVLFDFNSATISKLSARQLDKLADALKRCKDVEININGYADAKGKEAANKILSEKRAQSTVKYLTAKGINPNRLHIYSYGSMSPVALNLNPDGTDNPEGRKYNRRVEFNSLQTSNSCLTIDIFAIPSRLKIK